MREETFFAALVPLSFLLAGVTFVALFFVNAPYGRHARQGWGLMLSKRLGWLIMETPAAVLFAAFFISGSATHSLPSFIFLGMWEAHYLHRAFIYPFGIADGRKKIPALVVLMGFIFNTGNAYFNGRYLFTLSGGYPRTWLADPRSIIGLGMFIIGYIINRWADGVLFHLRKSGESGYQIPYGGLFDWVSCPNYFGEILEWAGWAMATWSLPGLSFAIWTIANLAPRARAHHIWYRANFLDYPKERKALIPGVW